MKKHFLEAGQALVTIIIFAVIAMSIITATVMALILNSKGATALEAGSVTHTLSESGIENAILRLLRDPNYAGETMSIEGNPVTITVTGSQTKTITATSQNGLYRRVVQATATYSGGIVTISSWQETP